MIDVLHQPTGRYERVGDMPDGTYFLPAALGLRPREGVCQRLEQTGFRVSCTYRRDWNGRKHRFTLFAHELREVVSVTVKARDEKPKLRRAA